MVDVDCGVNTWIYTSPSVSPLEPVYTPPPEVKDHWVYNIHYTREKPSNICEVKPRSSDWRVGDPYQWEKEVTSSSAAFGFKHTFRSGELTKLLVQSKEHQVMYEKSKISNVFSSRKYSRGRRVFVDFGYNIGKEASMKHPPLW
jgi:hypothetical protein